MNIDLLNSPTDGHKQTSSYTDVPANSYMDMYKETIDNAYDPKGIGKNPLRDKIYARQHYQSKCSCSEGKCLSYSYRDPRNSVLNYDRNTMQGTVKQNTLSDY